MPELNTETYGAERHDGDGGSRASSRRLDVPGSRQLRCKAIKFSEESSEESDDERGKWVVELDGQDVHRYKSARLRVPMPGIQEGSR